MKIALTADGVRGFTEHFLLDRYEEKLPIPKFHTRLWEDVCSEHEHIAIAAPRKHGKSTALNHAYGLAASLFEAHPFQLKVSRTYELACEKLKQAKEELIGNEKIKSVFRLKKIDPDTENDFVAEFSDGYRFRMRALGMEQATRGFSWGTMRPTLIQGDDMEDDEQVLSKKSRQKAMNWVMKVLLPIGSDSCKVRIYGTILHKDSVLARLLRNEEWKSSLYEACDANISRASILWPEKFPQDKLLRIKRMYVNDGNLIAFNMEYRNIAKDEEGGFFQPSDFVPMERGDRNKPHTIYVGADFAISTGKKANHTVFVIGGVDPEGFLDILEVRKGRWDSKQIQDNMISIQKDYSVDSWFCESGQILKSIRAGLEVQMRLDNQFLNIIPFTPISDKMTRAGPMRSRMRSRGVRFDKTGTWYNEYEQNLLDFRGGENEEDDEVDASAWLGFGISQMMVPMSKDQQDDEEWEYQRRKAMNRQGNDGRSRITGY